MKDLKSLFSLLVLFALILFGCKKNEIDNTGNTGSTETKPTASALTLKVNTFIKDAMEDVYLWYKEMPVIDVKYETDSKAYFKKLLYTDDKWSYITDNITAFENSLQGKETTYGFSLTFGKFSNTGNVFAVVEYVYPNTPASEAGFKRGDIIIKMNNADITVDNYMQLITSASMSVSLGILANNSISLGKTVSMTAKELNLNPVLIKKVIEHGGKKIGYLFYAQYISNYNKSLDTAFMYFRDQKITDLVLDLRYNPGGMISAAQYVCSSVAPLTTVNNKSTLVTFQWNDKYQAYWQKNNVTDQLLIPFVNTSAVKLGLSKMYILTGNGTASASELTITGLKPYMTIKTIGEKTYGKYTASITLKPEDIYTNASTYSEFKNWGLQPIVIRYANSQGVTDFKDGFVPDIAIQDDVFNTTQLGEKTEPFLKKAIEDITGVQVVALKKAEIRVPYNKIDQVFSKFDKNKREAIFDKSDNSLFKNIN